MGVFKSLSDNLLKESYNKAVKLNLNPDFINILEKEIEKRGLLKRGSNYITDLAD